ncbi:O-antigen ligase family protein [Variovorax sp. RT4R15]|uniref:O-antigen ligase family protein n=1 Tax=Variovorax sp. RT4R15 TaxID=3443737 RepID=UPI003F463077
MVSGAAVRFAVLFWGLVVFMPVGANYLGLAIVLLGLAGAGGYRERFDRFKANPLAWPIAVFAGWTIVVLACGPHYPETTSNLWHGMRIAITLAVATMLSVEEAAFGLHGYLAGALLAIVAMVLTHVAGLPDFLLWHNVAVMKGNKSINDALLFATLGASSAVWALDWSGSWRRDGYRPLLAATLTVGTAVIVTLALPSRTSLLALLAAVCAACLHKWRGRWRTLTVALCATAVISAALLSQAPSVERKFRLGVTELEAAREGTVSEGSWVVRFYMYRETTRMMLDRPWSGWGIGGWTHEWKQRAPELLADYNMPHNDFLWMGAQAGVPGMLTLVAIFMAGLRTAWQRRDHTGRMALAAMVILLTATCVNSAMRDAAIGLSLPWIVFLYLRRVQ